MTIGQWLTQATKKLATANIATARLDTEVLLADALRHDRAWLLAHPDFALQKPTLERLSADLARRTKHEPLAYIRGRQEFFGREFVVSPDTLTPRPETETLVEMALSLTEKHDVKNVADVGSGSGCIAITLYLESGRTLSCTGFEISRAALKIGLKNAERLQADVTFVQDDLTADGAHGWQKADMIVANLPYVPDNFKINLAATHEPPFAIYGGSDGLEYYRELFSKINKSRFVLTESMPPQHSALRDIARLYGYEQEAEQDFIQLFKRSQRRVPSCTRVGL